MNVSMDDLVVRVGEIRYHWTLTGTNTGPTGTSRLVKISGFETWRISTRGLIEHSQGQFDEAEYLRQLGE
jgi:hypothetical protein